MILKNAFPQPDFARSEWLCLNGEWDFSFDEPRYDLTINVPYPWGSPLSGIDDSRKGTGCYRKVVSWSPANERIFLVFGAVDYTCEVRVNGETVGTHRGGYDRFEFDVTMQWELVGENVIEVIATDLAERSQTYGKQGYGEACGIWQTVWLEARPDAYITGFFTKTKLDGRVTVEVEADAPNGSEVRFAPYSEAVLLRDGKATLEFKIDEPELWSPENPRLYDGELILTSGGEEDCVATYFGIREIGTGVYGKNGNRYITLNGEPYYINGVLDQSFNPQGYFTLPSDDDCREEILRLKRIGINMARIHIKAEEPLKLYWADKLGLLIMEDIPCFWGDPTPDVKAQYELELEAQIKRDRNHPSIFYWVVFNETWGLFTSYTDSDGAKKREYLPETAEWVVDCCRKTKALDPTRLVEDNSPCNRDHTVTDVNTWHFYSNGYENVKNVVDSFCDGAYVGSQENYKSGYKMADVPCMNSECGNVWGCDGNAGDSDISWQYRYMMNEFRLHDKLCGFVFTEFHDVVNEFNGYYKIDNTDKDFGYDAYGTSLCDLHSQDYVGVDFPPMLTVAPEQTVTIPMFVSSFTKLRHGKTLSLVFELVLRDPIWGDELYDSWETPVRYDDYGTTMLPDLALELPEHDGVAELRWTLVDGEECVMSNCVLFDVESERPELYELEPAEMSAKGFDRVIPSIQNAKLSGLGSGEFSAEIKLADIPDFAPESSGLRLVLEASTREPMTHDFPDRKKEEKIDLSYMLGYRCDPGANPNSYQQTDERTYPGTLELLLDGEKFATVALPDCPADSRGALSHHYQPNPRRLDEAGSYGYLVDVKLPSRLLLKLAGRESFTLTLRSPGEAGLALYGRKSGRYGIGITLVAE